MWFIFVPLRVMSTLYTKNLYISSALPAATPGSPDRLAVNRWDKNSIVLRRPLSRCLFHNRVWGRGLDELPVSSLTSTILHVKDRGRLRRLRIFPKVEQLEIHRSLGAFRWLLAPRIAPNRLQLAEPDLVGDAPFLGRRIRTRWRLGRSSVGVIVSGVLVQHV